MYEITTIPEIRKRACRQEDSDTIFRGPPMRVRVPALSSAAFYPPQLLPIPTAPPPDPWAELEWCQHPEAVRVVSEHPEGMTLEQIGRVMRVTRERVRQIEAGALRKLKECAGIHTITVGAFEIAVPDCAQCQLPFVRRTGRDRYCEACAERKAARRHH